MKKSKVKRIGAFLGGDTFFEGRLTFAGVAQIDGAFTGNIAAAGTLVIGENATVNADIQASEVVVGGSVTGNITAERTVEIRSSAKVRGDIQALDITIQPGAIFDGRCITQTASEIADRPAVTEDTESDIETPLERMPHDNKRIS